MAGLSPEGLVIKRLNEVIQDRIASSRRQFGNSVKVSVNDVIGRALRVGAESEADLWELLELEYNSLHPEFATGVSLDRVVSYGRITRQEAQPSTVSVQMVGDYGITVPEGSFITSPSTSNRFQTVTDVIFSRTNITGFAVEVLDFDNSTGIEYSFDVDGQNYSETIIASSLSDAATQLASGTLASSLSGLATLSVDDDNSQQVNIDFDDIFVSRAVQITSPNALAIRRVTKLATAESEEVGPVAQPAGTLTNIGTPTTGWQSVTNPLDASLGNERESDEELRTRFRRTKEINARGTVEALRSNLASLTGVDDVQVYENPLGGVDANGLPAHSFSAIVQGGNTLEVAQTIWETKPAGIQTYGNTSVNVIDSEGYTQPIDFSRPQEVPIYIDVEISALAGAQIPSNIERDIAAELQDYFNNNYSVGDNVVYSRLYTPINRSFDGFQIDALFIGTSASPTGTTNVTINFDQVATLARENVSVTINV